MKKSLILLNLFLLLSASITGISCSKSDDDAQNPYQGNWRGNLTGDIEGTWTAKVSSNGNFAGKVITPQSSPDHDFVLAGQVSANGNLVATMKNATYNMNLDFVGNFQNTNSNGTWIFNGAGIEGTWTGTKE